VRKDLPIHAVIACATVARWPCHARAIHVEVEPSAHVAIDSTRVVAPVDTPITRRPKAVQYSDWYSRRLTVHRIGSYTMLPLFAAEWSLGQNLLQDEVPRAGCGVRTKPWQAPSACYSP
jgi:hypothetical protein